MVYPPIVRDGLSARDNDVAAWMSRKIADDRRLDVDGWFHELSLAQPPLLEAANAAVQRRHGDSTSARHLHNEMAHMPRACDALAPSAATAC